MRILGTRRSLSVATKSFQFFFFFSFCCFCRILPPPFFAQVLPSNFQLLLSSPPCCKDSADFMEWKQRDCSMHICTRESIPRQPMQCTHVIITQRRLLHTGFTISWLSLSPCSNFLLYLSKGPTIAPSDAQPMMVCMPVACSLYVNTTISMSGRCWC